MSNGVKEIPRWWRWAAALWLAVWLPAYATTWGWRNFLALCDVAVIVTCAGLWARSALLLSSQALSAIMAGMLWAADVAARLLAGRHLFGGTEYMWDARVPLLVRLLSLFHLWLPVVVVLALRRTGYDRRGLWLQVALTAPLLVASRIFGAGKNVNYALVDPLLHRQWGPVPLHLLAMWVGTSLVVYVPTHLILARWLTPTRSARLPPARP
jgi:hypothetical protein